MKPVQWSNFDLVRKFFQIIWNSKTILPRRLFYTSNRAKVGMISAQVFYFRWLFEVDWKTNVTDSQFLACTYLGLRIESSRRPVKPNDLVLRRCSIDSPCTFIGISGFMLVISVLWKSLTSESWAINFTVEQERQIWWWHRSHFAKGPILIWEHL